MKKEYNVLAIGVSGISKEKSKVDVYYWEKKKTEPIYQRKLSNIFLTPTNYLKFVKGEKISKEYFLEEIRETALIFHDNLRKVKVTEQQKPIIIASILIALEDKNFTEEYWNLTSFSTIMLNLKHAVDKVLKKSNIQDEKREHIESFLTSVENNQKLKHIPLIEDGSIRWYIEQLEMKIKPMMNNADSSLDALGIFYHEFVKYSGGDGKGLGIVLTPQHLTEFMCDLADINTASRIVDICCGSASFLVSAMSKMFKQTGDPEVLEDIRKSHLYGIELDQDLHTLAIANMIIRRDGKSNIIHGDCFNSKVIDELRRASRNKLNVGLLNPPYSQIDHTELEFVEQLLKILQPRSTAVVVVPMSCAIGTKFKEERKRLFERHTLKAVFSMPDDIFYPIGTNVCVMVWEAHAPHDNSVKTFFGYCKDDGFVKRKKLGRVDIYNRWENIKKEWLSLYKNQEVRDGLSAKEVVSDTDEWLCEAYMKTDYSKLTQRDFEQTVRDYLAYLVKNNLFSNEN